MLKIKKCKNIKKYNYQIKYPQTTIDWSLSKGLFPEPFKWPLHKGHDGLCCAHLYIH